MTTSGTGPTLRVYLRRSKADEDHQQFSLDTQRAGIRRYVEQDLARLGLHLVCARRVEYVDDDRAGDDFLGRAALQRLLKETTQGDVIVCRDQSRLGRRALDVTYVVRSLVAEQGARLFFYAESREVMVRGAIDEAVTYIGGVGHQLELENIRSRTREALRERVRMGRVAGGRCFGYDPVRQKDASGRPYTVFVVNEAQAQVIRRIVREFLDHRGLKRIAAGLNADGIAPPGTGRRGTGSWAPSAIHVMLRNERYHGVYVHGRKNRVRRGGKRVAIVAKPEDVLRVDVPEWRILDEPTWERLQVQLAERSRVSTQTGPASKYPLSGIGRCAECGGAIGVVWTAKGKAYGCTWHHNRGASVCATATRQPRRIVEKAFADHLRESVLPALLRDVVAGVQAEVARRLAAGTNASDLERELARLRLEQKNVATAIATTGPIPELLAVVQERGEQIRRLEADLAIAKRTPEMLADLLRTVESTVGDQLAQLGTALEQDGFDSRQAYLSLFPGGLRFTSEKNPKRPSDGDYWVIRGVAQYKLRGDPNGPPVDLTSNLPTELHVIRAS